MAGRPCSAATTAHSPTGRRVLRERFGAAYCRLPWGCDGCMVSGVWGPKACRLRPSGRPATDWRIPEEVHRMADLSRSVAIVGVAESDEIGNIENKSSLQHHAEAAHNALEDAGLSMRDVNGLLTAGFSSMAVSEYLGLQPTYTDGTAVGGSSFVIHIAPRHGRHQRRLLRRCPDNPRRGGPEHPGPRVGRRGKPRPPVRVSLRPHWPACELRHGLPKVHAPLRRRPRETGHGRGGRCHPQVGGHESQVIHQGPHEL